MSIPQAIDTLRKKRDERKNTSAKLDSILQTANKNGQGIAAIVDHLPDAKKPTVISWKDAVAIMEHKGGDMTERTGRNWIKAGKAAKTGTPISWDNLSTVAAWSAWTDTYLAALKSRASCRKFISERAGMVESQKTRRMSPTA